MTKKRERFYVLGAKASVFFDPTTRLKVLSKTQPSRLEGAPSQRIKLAVDAGHIREVDAAAVADTPVADSQKGGFNAMTKQQLVIYYKENYEVSEEEVADFSKKSRDKQIAYLEELEGED